METSRNEWELRFQLLFWLFFTGFLFSLYLRDKDIPQIRDNSLIPIYFSPIYVDDFNCVKGGGGAYLYCKEYGSEFRIGCAARGSFDVAEFKNHLEEEYIALIDRNDSLNLGQNGVSIPVYSLVQNGKDLLPKDILLEAANDRMELKYPVCVFILGTGYFPLAVWWMRRKRIRKENKPE